MSKLEEKKVNKGPNLSDLSAPTPTRRGEGISDLIAPPPPPPPTDPQAESPVAPVAAESLQARRSPDLPDIEISPETAVPDAPSPAAGDQGASGDTPKRPRTKTKAQGGVYVSSGVKKRFEKYRHDSRLTNVQVVLQAVGEKHAELQDIIAAAKYSAAPVNPLFDEDPSTVRYLGGGSSQISFAPTKSQATKLDDIGKQLGFSTRSTWLAPVLNAFLPGRKDIARS